MGYSIRLTDDNKLEHLTHLYMLEILKLGNDFTDLDITWQTVQHREGEEVTVWLCVYGDTFPFRALFKKHGFSFVPGHNDFLISTLAHWKIKPDDGRIHFDAYRDALASVFADHTKRLGVSLRKLTRDLKNLTFEKSFNIEECRGGTHVRFSEEGWLVERLQPYFTPGSHKDFWRAKKINPELFGDFMAFMEAFRNRKSELN